MHLQTFCKSCVHAAHGGGKLARPAAPAQCKLTDATIPISRWGELRLSSQQRAAPHAIAQHSARRAAPSRPCRRRAQALAYAAAAVPCCLERRRALHAGHCCILRLPGPAYAVCLVPLRANWLRACMPPCAAAAAHAAALWRPSFGHLGHTARCTAFRPRIWAALLRPPTPRAKLARVCACRLPPSGTNSTSGRAIRALRSPWGGSFEPSWRPQGPPRSGGERRRAGGPVLEHRMGPPAPPLHALGRAQLRSRTWPAAAIFLRIFFLEYFS